MKDTTKQLNKIYKEMDGQIIDESIDSFVYLKNVRKVYPNGAIGVHEFTLGINRYDFVALVGPSGCGKSTTLRMIAGLEDITSGFLYIDKKLSNYTPSKDRDIAMVFQSYALYPHINVYDNIAFGLRLRKFEKDEIQRRVFEAARILNLGHYLDRKPKELSGGQMQRVALGRAIVREARIFLMDEPLSNLDAKLRVSMRGELVRIHEAAKATTIYVTHDQIEAMTMADKIVVMNKGYIQQVGTPKEVYEQPGNLFVATFIGTPSMNLFPIVYKQGVIKAFNTSLSIDGFGKRHDEFYRRAMETVQMALDDSSVNGHELLNRYASSQEQFVSDEKPVNPKTKKMKETQQDAIDVESKLQQAKTKIEEAITGEHALTLGIRSEHILLRKETDKGHLIPVIADVTFVELLGATQIIHASLDQTDITISADAGFDVKPHDKLEVFIRLDKIHIYDPITGKRIN